MSKIKAIGLVCTIGLAGCSATTSLETVQQDVSVRVNGGAPLDLSKDHTYSTTSFGQYRFKAEKEGMEPMYGLLPLKFNGGYLAADILFFAPALFFNLREVFPYYQLDTESNEVRYRKSESAAWMTYKPELEEVRNAKSYFDE